MVIVVVGGEGCRGGGVPHIAYEIKRKYLNTQDNSTIIVVVAVREKVGVVRGREGGVLLIDEELSKNALTRNFI